jgi:very-short-patch-repair endonuclease
MTSNHLRNSPDLKVLRRKLRTDQTDAERKLWGLLRQKQFHGCKFYRQYSVGRFILDFYSPSLQIAIELDGSQHLEPEYHEKDDIRTKYLNDLGIKVIRFYDNDVLRNIDGVYMILEQIRSQTPPASS